VTNAEVAPTKDTASSAPSANADWTLAIEYRAVECADGDIIDTQPPFPFIKSFTQSALSVDKTTKKKKKGQEQTGYVF